MVDTDGFVIPSLGIEDSDQSKPHVPIVESSNSAAKVSYRILIGDYNFLSWCEDNLNANYISLL